jgi:hypothetical protein
MINYTPSQASVRSWTPVLVSQKPNEHGREENYVDHEHAIAFGKAHRVCYTTGYREWL